MPYTVDELKKTIEKDDIEKIKEILKENRNLAEGVFQWEGFVPSIPNQGNIFAWLVCNKNVHTKTITEVAKIIGTEKAANIASTRIEKNQNKTTTGYNLNAVSLNALDWSVNESIERLQIILNILDKKKEKTLISKTYSGSYLTDTAFHKIIEQGDEQKIQLFLTQIEPYKILFILNEDEQTPITIAINKKLPILNSEKFQRLILSSLLQIYLKNIPEKPGAKIITSLLSRLNNFIHNSQIKSLTQATLHQFGKDQELTKVNQELEKCQLPEAYLLRGYLAESNKSNPTKILEYFSLAFDKAEEELKNSNISDSFPNFLATIQNLATDKLKELIVSLDSNLEENKKLIEHIKIQIAKTPDINRYKRTDLETAIENNRIEKIKEILQQNSKLWDITFHFANKEGTRTTEYNIFGWGMLNADIQIETIRAIANELRPEKTTQLITKTYGNFDNGQGDDWHALHHAIFSPHIKIEKIKVILDMLGQEKENLLTSKTNKLAKTPLHIAVESKGKDKIELLLSSIEPGRILFIRDKDNKTPVDLMLKKKLDILNNQQFQRLILVSSIHILLLDANYVAKNLSDVILTLKYELIKDSQLKSLSTAIVYQSYYSLSSSEDEFKNAKEATENYKLAEADLLRFLQNSNDIEFLFSAFKRAKEEQSKLKKTDKNFLANITLAYIQDIAVEKLTKLLPADVNQKITLNLKLADCYYLQEKFKEAKETLEKIKDDLKSLTETKEEHPELKEFNRLSAAVDYNLALKCNSENEKIKLLQSASKQGHAEASVYLAERAMQQSDFIQAIKYYIEVLHTKYELNIPEIIKKLEASLNKLTGNSNTLSELRFKAVWAIKEKVETFEIRDKNYKSFLEKLSKDGFLPAKYVLLVYFEAPSITFGKMNWAAELKAITTNFFPANFTYAEWMEKGAYDCKKNVESAFKEFGRILLHPTMHPTNSSEFKNEIIKKLQIKSRKKIEEIITKVDKGNLKCEQDVIDFKFKKQIWFALAEENLDQRRKQLQAIATDESFTTLYKNWLDLFNKGALPPFEYNLALTVFPPQNSNSNLLPSELESPDKVTKLYPQFELPTFPEPSAPNRSLTKEDFVALQNQTPSPQNTQLTDKSQLESAKEILFPQNTNSNTPQQTDIDVKANHSLETSSTNPSFAEPSTSKLSEANLYPTREELLKVAASYNQVSPDHTLPSVPTDEPSAYYENTFSITSKIGSHIMESITPPKVTESLIKPPT